MTGMYVERLTVDISDVYSDLCPSLCLWIIVFPAPLRRTMLENNQKSANLRS